MDKIPPPVETGRDNISIHLSYIRRDMDEMKQAIHELKGVYVTRDEFKPLADEVSELRNFVENKLATKEEVNPIKKGFWGFLGISGTILLGFVYNYFLVHR